ncbi:MAG: carbohydrate ABC transporter permease [Chloroflexales bacterium]|nr:carbohydrate ABC transporter permease [Chloroflexales bacterium]
MTTQTPSPALPFWKTRHGQQRLSQTLALGVILAGATLLLLPFFWMISTSLKRPDEIYLLPPVWLPPAPQWSNYVEALTLVPMHLYALNTFTIVGFVLVGTLLSCSFSAYGFARLHAPGRDQIFLVLLATLMLPSAVTLVPTYLLFNSLGWVNTLLPLIVPAFFGSAFFIFLLRQFYTSVPIELEEAATIDGAGPYRIWWHIMLPLSMPALATVAVFTFVATYNDFFTPLIYLTDDTRQTIAVALSYFQGSPRVGPQMHLLMAAVALSIIPPMLLFLAAQRYFVRGIATTGLKG